MAWRDCGLLDETERPSRAPSLGRLLQPAVVKMTARRVLTTAADRGGALHLSAHGGPLLPGAN